MKWSIRVETHGGMLMEVELDEIFNIPKGDEIKYVVVNRHGKHLCEWYEKEKK